MILVVGATGHVGRTVVRKLRDGGQPVRALVRPGSDPAKRRALEDAGATLVDGDLKDPASIARACEHAQTVISTASATISRQPGDSLAAVDRDGQIDLVEAARRAGAGHFVYVSVSGNLDVPSPLHDSKRAVEKALHDGGGMAYTILRPSLFMQIWLSPLHGFDPASGSVRVLGSGRQPINWISLDDVAAYIVACVGNPAVRDCAIELGGPEALSPDAVVAMCERAFGRPIQVERVPEAALEQGYAAAGDDPMRKSFAALMLAAARGDAIDTRAAREKASIDWTPVEQYVKQLAAR